MSEIDRITAYLSGGGLFNPELANHDAVRDLLTDCRDAIETRNVRITELVAALKKFVDYDSADDDDGVTMMLNYNDAITAAREALKEQS